MSEASRNFHTFSPFLIRPIKKKETDSSRNTVSSYKATTSYNLDNRVTNDIPWKRNIGAKFHSRTRILGRHIQVVVCPSCLHVYVKHASSFTADGCRCKHGIIAIRYYLSAGRNTVWGSSIGGRRYQGEGEGEGRSWRRLGESIFGSVLRMCASMCGSALVVERNPPKPPHTR